MGNCHADDNKEDCETDLHLSERVEEDPDDVAQICDILYTKISYI